MTDLRSVITQLIAAKGPITVADYMELALQHPEFGYYRSQTALGKDGDFVTAPEISQMFGEMIGLWCADMWRQMGQPADFTLLELGPGRGTLMQDALRATAKMKEFQAAAKVSLFESNATLRAQQQERLDAYAPHYIDDLADLAERPTIIIANEFFDALPIRQFEKTDAGWCERLVGFSGGELAMTLSPPGDGFLMLLPDAVREAKVGSVHEVSLPSLSILRQLAKHVTQHGGAILVIDYGASEPAGASTLQAVSGHKTVSVFEQPGEVDLTAHVDFNALRIIAAAQRLTIFGPAGQGSFLAAMGIELRAAQLKLQASAVQAAAIDAALARLVSGAHMGQLFKVMAVVHPGLHSAGFP